MVIVGDMEMNDPTVAPMKIERVIEVLKELKQENIDRPSKYFIALGYAIRMLEAQNNTVKPAWPGGCYGANKKA